MWHMHVDWEIIPVGCAFCRGMMKLVQAEKRSKRARTMGSGSGVRASEAVRGQPGSQVPVSGARKQQVPRLRATVFEKGRRGGSLGAADSRLSGERRRPDMGEERWSGDGGEGQAGPREGHVGSAGGECWCRWCAAMRSRACPRVGCVAVCGRPRTGRGKQDHTGSGEKERRKDRGVKEAQSRRRRVLASRKRKEGVPACVRGTRRRTERMPAEGWRRTRRARRRRDGQRQRNPIKPRRDGLPALRARLRLFVWRHQPPLSLPTSFPRRASAIPPPPCPRNCIQALRSPPPASTTACMLSSTDPAASSSNSPRFQPFRDDADAPDKPKGKGRARDDDAPDDDPEAFDEYSGDDDAGSETEEQKALTTQALKADGTPKRPMNAFLLYAKKRRPEISADNPTMRTGEISKILSREWQNMDKV
ncbi:hypothetical protein BOTBODRAFT_575815 [Botryobasidium botryosum FD-172 SS1]|uniref:HMG box domain-containing protein n=1 Tax=Botryobasidium botryosum (strain FD-172 SS1) TaxID=930990 RepID=A0A067N144_BOTB1|nr:hypothetical protein BOTBODRAFT_575815 [Botryobasidium botryosum FD-172 SS1]